MSGTESKKKQYRFFIDKLKIQETILKDFDEDLWTAIIEKVVVREELSFYFKNGTEITI